MKNLEIIIEIKTDKSWRQKEKKDNTQKKNKEED